MTASDIPDAVSRTGGRVRKRGIAIMAGLVLVGTTVAAIALGWTPGWAQRSNIHSPPDDEQSNVPTRVKAVHPKRETAAPIVIEQLALVEPFYLSDLRARASGIVRSVQRDIGDQVRAGELLVEIDVPESDQDVARAEATILQRQQELKVSDAKLKDSRASRDVAAATIKQREADVEAAVATRDLKKRKYERFVELGKTGSVVGSVIEEEERDYYASNAAVTSARANVERARADLMEAESRIEAAAADIELKKAQIKVAEKDLDRAKVVADYGKIRAPFDGVVVRRAIDQGSFVQNATSNASEALISVARVDLITVVARFPDSAAPFVTNSTPAVIRFDELPSLSISCNVTRFSPSVLNADRTMRVEVDLFNGDDSEYQRLSELLQRKGTQRLLKGERDTLPMRTGAGNRRVLPGMTGTMRLAVQGFGDSYVLPSTAVYSRSGTSYVLLVQNGHTRQAPVKVQMNDGRTARIALITPKDKPGTAPLELRSDDIVIVSRQLELGDGVPVTPTLVEW